ncbi:MAG: hypothetical protein MMC33_001675 [Icmadophila ericetorum]|nr:hypothetical protein [Icmadophila ericetorum]
MGVNESKLPRAGGFKKGDHYDMAKLLERLPPYLPSLARITEYYAFGHDQAHPQLNEDIINSTENPSVFFTGIGDGRNLYATLMTTVEYERTLGCKRAYHFTINDIKPTILSRNSIVLLLLDDLSKLPNKASDQSDVLLASIFYVFAGIVMPAWCSMVLQKAIDLIFDALSSDENLPGGITILVRDKNDYRKILNSWKEGANSMWNVQLMLDVQKAQSEYTLEGLAGNASGYSPNVEEDEKMFKELGLLFPSEKLLLKYEPVLHKLLVKYKAARSAASKEEILAYVQTNWRVNHTFLDPVWDAQKVLSPLPTHNPFDMIDRMFTLSDLKRPHGRPRLFDHGTKFFASTASAMGHLRGRVVYEMIIGDFSKIAQELKYETVENRIRDSPKIYDRVHMSNVPDYIGGLFSGIVYAGKLLKPGGTFGFRIIYNARVWTSISGLCNEYFLANDQAMLVKLGGIKYLGPAPNVYCPNPPLFLSYLDWQLVSLPPHSPPQPSLLFSLTDLTTWLYAFFFKLLLPTHQLTPQIVGKTINSPLNATAFFHLLTHLSELGYPASTLTKGLTTILSNRIITPARPPRTRPLQVSEVRLWNGNIPKKLSVAPFIAEMKTLTTLFLPFLPFAPHIKTRTASTLPSASSIYHYSIPLPRSLSDQNNLYPPIFILVFFLKPLYDAVCNEHHVEFDLHDILDPEGTVPSRTAQVESGRNVVLRGRNVERLRDEGTLVVTTWEWEQEQEVGSFWIGEGVMDRMMPRMGAAGEKGLAGTGKRKGKGKENKKKEKSSRMEEGAWMVGIWRNDTWENVVRPVTVSEKTVRKGESWVTDTAADEGHSEGVDLKKLSIGSGGKYLGR